MSEAGKFRVAIDAMGGDFAPMEPVAGAVQAAREYGYHVLLVGDQSAVESRTVPLGCGRPGYHDCAFTGSYRRDGQPGTGY